MTFFVVCFGIGAGFTIISFLLGHLDFSDLGGHFDAGAHFDAAHTDAHFDAAHGGAHAGPGGGHFHFSNLLSIFRPAAISLFLVVFGGSGIVLLNMTAPFVYAVIIGAVIGAFCVYLLIKLVLNPLSRAQNTSALSNDELMWNMAQVCVRIPASGLGEISYTIKDSVGRGPARTRGGQEIAAGESVIIEGVEDGVFYVARCAAAADKEKNNIMQ